MNQEDYNKTREERNLYAAEVEKLKKMFEFVCVKYYKKLHEEPSFSELKPLPDFIEHQKKLFNAEEAMK